MAIPMNSNGTINFDRVFNMWKGSNARPVHNQKEYDKALTEGYGEWTPHPYPQTLHNTEGVSKIVNSEEEEKTAGADGFIRGRKHVVKPKVAEVAAPMPFVPHNDMSGAIQALESRTNAQDERLGKIEELLYQLVESATDHPARKKKGE